MKRCMLFLIFLLHQHNFLYTMERFAEDIPLDYREFLLQDLPENPTEALQQLLFKADADLIDSIMAIEYPLFEHIIAPEICKQLKAGAHFKRADGYSAKQSRMFKKLLKLAAAYDQTSIIEALLDTGMDVNGVVDKILGTPLCVASFCGRADSVTLLLEKGASVNKPTGFNIAPVEYAVDQLEQWRIMDVQSESRSRAQYRPVLERYALVVGLFDAHAIR